MIIKDKLWTRNFTLIGIANLLMAIAFYFMLPTLPLYLKENLGATSGQVGLILSCYTISALLIRPFIGYAIDSIGRRFIYLLSFIIFSSLFIGYIYAITFGLMIVVRLLHGLTWGSLSTTGSTIAVDFIPASRRGEGISLFGLSMTIAMAIGPLIALTILGLTDYYWVFITAMLISILGLIQTFFIRFPIYNSLNKEHSFSFRKLIEKTSIPISVNVFLITITYGGLLSFASIYGREIGVINSGLFFLLLAGGIGVSRLFSGTIFDRVGPYRIVIIGSVLLIIGFPLLFFFPNTYGFHSSAVVLGLGFGIIMPTFQSMVNNVVPHDRRGAANSTYFTCFDLGIGFGMILTGLLSEKIGLDKVLALNSIIIVVALVFFILRVYDQYDIHFRINK